MTESTKKRRSHQITIKLDPKILAGLHEIADTIGIAPTTLAGMAIGEYVAKTQSVLSSQSRMTEAMAQSMASVIGAPIAALFQGKSLEEIKEEMNDD